MRAFLVSFVLSLSGLAAQSWLLENPAECSLMPSHFGPQKLTVAPHLTPLTLTWCGIRAPGWVPRCFISVTMDITTLGREMCRSVPLQDCGRNPLWSVKVQSELHSGYFCFFSFFFTFFLRKLQGCIDLGACYLL